MKMMNMIFKYFNKGQQNLIIMTITKEIKLKYQILVKIKKKIIVLYKELLIIQYQIPF